MIGFLIETEFEVAVHAHGDGDPADVDWHGVLVTAWRVMRAMREAGMPVCGMAICDLEARL